MQWMIQLQSASVIGTGTPKGQRSRCGDIGTKDTRPRELHEKAAST